MPDSGRSDHSTKIVFVYTKFSIYFNHSEAKPDFNTKLLISSCRDRALLVSGSNTAKQATLVALLDPSTHSRPPLTHTSHHRLALVDLRRVSGVS
jgi:hypothetical protein